MKKRSALGGYRSGMEKRLVPPLLLLGHQYEPLWLTYAAPDRKYTPDVVLSNGIALEIKGWFKASDRSKLLLVKAAYPLLDLRMVLASPHQTLSKKSKTTLAQWCVKHDIPWSDNGVPVSWLIAEVNSASKAILDGARRHKEAA